MFAALLATAAPASAQTSVLVSNIGETLGGGGRFSSFDMAQAFTTGDNATGYTLTSVEINLSSGSAAPTNYSVSIWTSTSTTGSNPYTIPNASHGTLTNPATVSDGNNTFTTSGINLDAETTYVVVLDSSDTSIKLWNNTSLDAQTGLSEWSIADGSIYRNRSSTGGWTSFGESKRIRLNGTAKTTSSTTPTVSSVAVTSTPSAASDTYGVGEAIEFTVTFSRAVEVSTGQPHFEFALGNSGSPTVDKDAAYQSGSGTTALVFAYTVLAADMDDNGIWVGDQSRTLMLDTGEYIRAVDDQTSATLTHAALSTQSDHKVDGSLMVTNNAPVFAAEASTRELTENVAANVNVGAPVRATDGDGDTLTYSFGGTDVGKFNFNASTQQITTKSGQTYDYETNTSYTVTVTATDGTTPTTVTVTINVIDLPAISIAPEPGKARLLITAGVVSVDLSGSPRPSGNLTINFSAQQDHDWFSSSSLTGSTHYDRPDDEYGQPSFTFLADAPVESGDFTVTLQPGDGYEIGTAAATVEIVAADPVITVRAAEAAYSFGEGDGTVTVTLTAETIADAPKPRNSIFVNWSTTAGTATGGGTDFENGNGEVLFGSGNFTQQGTRWVATKDIEVILVDDAVKEETEQFQVTLTRHSSLHPLVKLANVDRSLCAPGVNCGTTVTILDNEPGVTISKTALDILEGGTGSYTVVLDSEPTATVTVTPSRTSGDTDITVSGALTFTTTTWSVAQTVTVSAAEDDSDSDVDRAVIGHAVSGGNYASVTAASVAVTAADNDAPDESATGKPTISGTAQVGQTLIAAKGSIDDPNGLTKADNDETGFAYTYQWIRVDSDGTSNPMNVGTDSDAYPLVAADEDKQIRVRVSFVDDNGYAEARTSDPYPSSDTVLPSSAVSLLLSPASIRENGGTTRIRARLNVESSAETTVTVSVEPVPPAVAGDYELSANTVLTIPVGRTSSTGLVTLTAVNNDVDADDKTVIIRGVAENSAGVGAPAEQTLTIEDDDQGVRLSPTSLMIDEGRSKGYTVVLGSRPTGSVTVTPQDPPGMVTVSGPLVFTRDNWDEPQTVTVTAGQDEDEEDETVQVTHLVSGADYGGFTAGSVRVMVSDDDGGTGVLEVGVYDGSAGAGVKDPPPRVHFGQRFRLDLVWSHLRTKHWAKPEGAIGPTRAIRVVGGTVRPVQGRFSVSSHGWDQSRLTLEVTPVPSADSDDVTLVLEPLDCSSNDPKALCSLDRGRWTGLAKRVRFTVRGITGAPVMAAAELDLTVTPQERRGKDSFLVSFDADEEGTRFRLQMQEAGGDWSRKSEWTGAMRSENQHRVTVDGVSHDDAYQFRVRWENRFGNGPWAQASTAGAAPAAPTGLRLTPMYQDKSLALAWTPVTQAGVRIERFQYRIDRTRSEELVILSDTGPMQYRGNWVDIPNSGRGNANYRSWTIGGLANMWAARIRVRAVNESGRAGTPSAEAVAPLDVPRVADISMASDPGADGYYTYGNKIGINVRLSRPVRIPGNDQRPSLDVEIGGGVYSMGLVSIRQSVAHELIGQAPWSGDVLLFEHSLGTGDVDHNGIRVPASALKGNGGRLLDLTPAGEGQLADLAVSTAKTFPAHRVNTVPPRIVRMTWQQNLDANGVVRGAEVRIHYDRDLDPNSRLSLDWNQYRVEYSESRALGRDVTGLSIGDATDDGVDNPRTVRLVLKRVVHGSGATPHNSPQLNETVWVTYTGVGVSGNSGRRFGPFDTLGNPVAGFTRRVAEHVTATQAALAAEFRNVPAGHNSPFTFEVHFSEEVTLTEEMLLNSVFTVTNGTVSAARRLNPPSNIAWEITVDSSSDEAVTVVLPKTTDCTAAGAICTWDNRPLSAEISATVVGPPTVVTSVAATNALTAELRDLPESHDGSAFTFELRFSEAFPISYLTLRDRAFTVTNGHVTGARRLDNPHHESAGMQPNREWEITVEPATGAEEVSITLPATTDCTATGAICTADDRALSVGVAVFIGADSEDEEAVVVDEPTVEPTPNATGAPVITGTTQVGKTLTAAKGSIADTDGLTRADASATGYTYSYQWMRVDGTSNTGITGATSSTYTLAAADEDKKLKVKVSFQDDAGTDEARTSAATGTVAPVPPPPPPPLTAAFSDVPPAHDGETTFDMEFRLSEEPHDLSYVTVRDSVFDVTGGRIERAKRLTQGKNQGWALRVAPSGDGDVTVRVKNTTSCTSGPKLCSEDGRMLAGGLQVSIEGPPPPALSVADATVQEAAGATLAFAVTLDRTPTAAVTVEYATADGTGTRPANAGTDYTATSGTLTFAVGESSKTVSVTVLDDSHDEGAETMSLTLSNPSGASIADATATGTITNTDPMPLAWLSRFGRTVGTHVMTMVDERMLAASQQASHLTLNGRQLQWGTPGSADTSLSGRARALLGNWTRDRQSLETLLSGNVGGSPREVFSRSSFYWSNVPAAGSDTGQGVASGDTVSDWMPGQARHDEGGAAGPEPLWPDMGQAQDGESSTPSFPRTRESSEQTVAAGDTLFDWTPGQARHDEGGAAEPEPLWPDMGQAQDGESSTPSFPRTRESSGQRVAAGDTLFDWTPGQARSDEGGAAGPEPLWPGTTAADTGSRWSVWGRGMMTGFNGQDGDVSLNGDVLTGLLAADYSHGRLLAGVSLSYSDGHGSYSQPGGPQGKVKSTLTGVHPYLRYALNQSLSVWGVLGYGQGAVTLTPGSAGDAGDGLKSVPGEVIETDMSLGMGAFGARATLLSGNGLNLALKSDVLLVRTGAQDTAGLASLDAVDTSRLRLALEGSRLTQWANGRSLLPALELGLRYDDGDAETGVGAELGGRVQYQDMTLGLTVATHARVLLAHEDSGYEEWGLGGSLRLDPGAAGRGASLDLRSTWGAVASGIDGLWSQQTTAGLARGGMESNRAMQFETRLGYGLEVPGGRNLLTPYGGLTLAGPNSRVYRLGGVFRRGELLELSLDAERRENLGALPDHGVMLRGSMPW